jgi:hypothetical protein
MYFLRPILETGDRLGIEDWDVLLFYHGAVIKSVYEFGSLPFWNPWYCGGNVLWQNPQVALLSPTYAFAAFVPLALAMKLNIVVHYLLGFAGMHLLLTRAIGLANLPAVFFLACVFTLAGGPVFHLAVGHATFLPYFFLPWILFCLLRGIETGQLRYAAGAAGVSAIAVYNGGIHIAFMMAAALVCFCVMASLLRRDWRPIAMLAAVGTLAALLAAPKLVPATAFVRDARTVDARVIPPGADFMDRDMLMRAFLDPFQYRRLRFEGQNYGWHEYGNYIGPLGGVLVAASLVWILLQWRAWRELWVAAALALTAVVLLSIAVGEIGPYAPYALLRKLPVVSQFRVPSRYLVVFVLFAAAMIGSAWRHAAPALPLEARRFAAIVLVLSSCALAYWNHIQFEGVFTLAPLESSFRWLARPGEPAIDHVTEGLAPARSPMLRALVENRSIVRCYEPLRLSGDLAIGRPVVFADPGGQVGDIEFAPNRIAFRALAGPVATRVFLNQRFATGWSSDAGSMMVDPSTGLAYIELPPGAGGRFTFSFAPPLLVPSLILFTAGIALAAAMWRRTLAPGSMVQFSHAVR